MTLEEREIIENLQQRVEALERQLLSLNGGYGDLNPKQVAMLIELKYSEGPVTAPVLGHLVGVNDRTTAWRYLDDLKSKGYVFQPRGDNSKKGWSLTGKPIPATLET